MRALKIGFVIGVGECEHGDDHAYRNQYRIGQRLPIGALVHHVGQHIGDERQRETEQRCGRQINPNFGEVADPHG